MPQSLADSVEDVALTPEELHDAKLTADQKVALRRQVTRRFRGGVTPYLSSLIKASEPIRKQFVPEYLEGLAFGRSAPFEEGKDNRGIYGLERVYADRAVLTPYFDCAAYCRYCFKKTRTLAGNGRVMSEADISQALAFIASDSRLDTVLITGGDPLARPDMLEGILEGLSRISHVTKIRIGTRHILFNPDQITDALCALLARYNGVTVTDRWTGRNLSVGVSLNHPDELTQEVVAALQRIMRAGIAIRGQMVLLKGINDDAATLGSLLDRFVMLSIVPYYLFHCMDVVGTYHFRTSVQKGLDILAALASRSGVYAPTYVYVTPVGKHRVAPGSRLDYRQIDGRRYIRAISPYRADDFLAFSGRDRLPSLHERGPDGFVVSHYLDGNDDPADQGLDAKVVTR
jgi:lysine 2,3-aminomutase